MLAPEASPNNLPWDYVLHKITFFIVQAKSANFGRLLSSGQYFEIIYKNLWTLFVHYLDNI